MFGCLDAIHLIHLAWLCSFYSFCCFFYWCKNLFRSLYWLQQSFRQASDLICLDKFLLCSHTTRLFALWRSWLLSLKTLHLERVTYLFDLLYFSTLHSNCSFMINCNCSAHFSDFLYSQQVFSMIMGSLKTRQKIFYA